MGDPIHPPGPRVKHVLLSLLFSSYRCLCTFSCFHLVLIGEEEEKEKEKKKLGPYSRVYTCYNCVLIYYCTNYDELNISLYLYFTELKISIFWELY